MSATGTRGEMSAQATSYQVLPDLSTEDYERLRESIAERGVLVPVEIDEAGNILDGHHRDRIARDLGMDYPTVTRDGLAEHEKRIHAVTLNVARRQLTDAQRVLVGLAIEPDIAERARLRQLAALKKGDEPGTPLVTSVTDGRVTDEVAATVGLGSGRTYERGKRDIERIETLAPQFAPALASGSMDLKEKGTTWEAVMGATAPA